jgi:hypothetical protein
MVQEREVANDTTEKDRRDDRWRIRSDVKVAARYTHDIPGAAALG